MIPAHFVFVAKYRRRVFDGDAINRLRIIFASSFGGAPISIVRQYIKQQQTPH